LSLEVNEGLELLLSRYSPSYPRRIMTKTQPIQWKVNSDKEVLSRFKAANYMDCRISLYPYLDENVLTPDVLYIDLDDVTAKEPVRRRIEQILPGASLTIISTGRGLAIIIPVDSREFVGLCQRMPKIICKEPMKKILSFAAQELSRGEADIRHSPTFGSCLVRVPGTINSNNGARVKVLEQWDGVSRPSLLPLYRPFLNDLVIKAEEVYQYDNSRGKIPYIEKLLETPLLEWRKQMIERVICPYLMVRGMYREEAYLIVKEWYDKCLALQGARKLPNRIEYYLDYSHQRYKPLTEENFRRIFPEVYKEIQQKT
jgi:hypothetical protein